MKWQDHDMHLFILYTVCKSARIILKILNKLIFHETNRMVLIRPINLKFKNNLAFSQMQKIENMKNYVVIKGMHKKLA